MDRELTSRKRIDQTMSDDPVNEQLDRARVELLDLTARNRMISTARSSSRSSRLEVVDELSDEVFRRLCIREKAMTFRAKPTPKPDEGNESDVPDVTASTNAESKDTDSENVESNLNEPSQSIELGQPDDDRPPEEHHVDRFLQTDLDSKKLQSRLLRLFYDARTYEQEHGANALYLALGFLKWYESSASDRPRYAPLILVPVTLERRNANTKFRLEATDDEISTNLSLQEKFRLEFGIQLPEIPESFRDDDSSLPSDYFDLVRKSISDQPRWEVLDNDIVLWLYSFAKFLMYQDLSPDSWPEGKRIHRHPLIQSLLGEGFEGDQLIFNERDSVDRIITPREMFHVVDADSSQMLVIEESKCGTNLVVQGPPGTGKSQTIANMIATAVQSGKRVLFVAEKMAALDVVKRRMDDVGLGELCLELHSHKANKRDLLKDLHKTLHLPKPKRVNATAHADELAAFRNQLTQHADAMHTAVGESEQTVFDAIGQLVRLDATGVPPAEFQIEFASEWSHGEMLQRRRLVEDLVTQIDHVGIPAQHPWRGCGLTSSLPAETRRILNASEALARSLEKFDAAADKLKSMIGCVDEESLRGASQLAGLADLMCEAPVCDRKALISEAWFPEHRTELKELVKQIGPTATRCVEDLDGIVTDAAWEADLQEIRKYLAAHGRSWFRIFNRDYRTAFASLAGLLVRRPPKSIDERLRIVDTLIEGQKARAALADSTRTKAAFGSQYREEKSDWRLFGQVVDWFERCESRDVPRAFFESFSNQASTESLSEASATICSLSDSIDGQLQDLIRMLRLDVAVAFGVDQHDAIDRDQLKERLSLWGKNEDKLSKWIAYHLRFQKVVVAGLNETAEQIHNGTLDSKSTVSQFERAYYEGILRRAYDESPELAEFDGDSHNHTRKKFVELDHKRIEIARAQVATKHHSQLPAKRKSKGMSVLRHEMKKRSRHKPVRRLIELAGDEIQAIKPVFMMSPMSIAQYLPPGAVEFDLLVIDEASQVRPSDAIGAMARAKQVVVVGDDMQLPPTSFFHKVVNDEGDQRGETQSIADLESILGLCESKNMPSRMLRWHYRSQHQSLIAVSNREFYNNQLYVVPSPYDESHELGLKFRFVPDGIYDRGGTSVNQREASAVADAVMQHAINHPQKSLGVGAFSVSQRDAILDELEKRRRAHPQSERFFVDDGPEPFFVKNLENIQGDERDCIFISVGYGREQNGKIAMNFGPLNLDGGERRLNVLISRAKERCKVFSSITANDIDLSKTAARGVAALKTFLNYAELGVLEGGETQSLEYGSEFERQIGAAIEQRGFEIHPQVGMEGFVVDLAVINPNDSSRYLVGIECDGESYRIAPSARDRDRIRNEVLEKRNWLIHRIWSIDWFQQFDEQLQRTLAVIDEAREKLLDREETTTDVNQITDEPNSPTIERVQSNYVWGVRTVPYQESEFAVDRETAIHRISSEGLINTVVRIVEIEGPIHEDEVQNRVRSLWGVSRTGKRITESIDQAIRDAHSQQSVNRKESFLWPTKMTTPTIRDRTAVWQSSLKDPDHVSPEEFELVIDKVFHADTKLSAKEMIRRVSAVLGIRRPTLTVIDKIEGLVRQRS